MNLLLPTIGVSDLQRRGRGVIRDVARSRKPYLVMNRNKPAALFMSVRQFDNIDRELQKLREESRIAEKVHRAEEDVRRGRVHAGNLRALLA